MSQASSSESHMIQLLSHFRVRAHKRIFLPRKLFVLLTHQHTQGVCPGQIRGGYTAVDRGGWFAVVEANRRSNAR